MAIVLGAVALYALADVLYFGRAERSKITDKAYALAGGNIEHGRSVIVAVGCGACHEIPGIASARGQVGPSLQGVAGRAMIGGVVPNTADNLARWVENPRAINAKTAMPVLGLTAEQARDVTAYLYARAQ